MFRLTSTTDEVAHTLACKHLSILDRITITRAQRQRFGPQIQGSWSQHCVAVPVNEASHRHRVPIPGCYWSAFEVALSPHRQHENVLVMKARHKAGQIQKRPSQFRSPGISGIMAAADHHSLQAGTYSYSLHT